MLFPLSFLKKTENNNNNTQTNKTKSKHLFFSAAVLSLSTEALAARAEEFVYCGNWFLPTLPVQFNE